MDRIRAALGRREGLPVPDPPPVRLRIPEVSLEARIASMTARLEALSGRVVRVKTVQAAGAWVAEALANRTAIASNAPFLEACGVTRIPGIQSGVTDRDKLRQHCATVDVGISSADYALADTGTLVMLSSQNEARMISLLPPAHIAVLPVTRILTGLDELLSVVPNAASVTSSMVLITGPSRTADIEQILVRGVHGPGQLTAVLVDSTEIN
jgi:L-lactate dehydrogenase complex protein LldG